MKKTMVLLAMFSLWMPLSAGAQLQDDPIHGCGESGSTEDQCKRCTSHLISLDSEGNGVYEYECTAVSPSPLFNSSRNCTAHSSGCSQSDWCLVT